MERALSSIADEVASADPVLAIEMYQRLPRDKDYGFLAGRITSQLWKSDPEAALQWAFSLERASEKSEAIEKVENAVFYGQSPEAAAALLHEHPENAALGTIAEEFARKYSDAEGIEWAQKFPPVHGEALTRKLFDNWAGSSPKSAAEYLQSGAIPGHLRSAAVSALARRWFSMSPEQATSWAHEFLANSPTPDADHLAIARAIRVANLTEEQIKQIQGPTTR
ncbi:MAG: hypothetical protein ACI9R3_003017 [Verrucomicrobiales bacterium]